MTLTGTLQVDTFSRTVSGGWGTPDSGGAYSAYTNQSNFSVTSGVQTGNIHIATTNSVNTVNQTNFTAQDIDQEITFFVPSVPTGANITMYISSRVQDVNNYYRCRVVHTTGNSFSVQIQRVVAGASSDLLATPVTAVSTVLTNTQYTARFQIFGGNTPTLRAKLYQTSGGEPGSWLASTGDGAPFTGTGGAAIRLLQATGGTSLPTWKFKEWNIDTLVAPAQPTITGIPAGNVSSSTPVSLSFSSVTSGVTYEVSTDNQATWNAQTSPYSLALTTVGVTYPFAVRAVNGASITSTAATTSITRTSTKGSVLGGLVLDNFDRTVASGWGTPDTGSAYAGYGNKAQFSTNGSQGLINLNNINAFNNIFTAGYSIQDSDQQLIFQVPNSGDLIDMFLVARYVDSSNYYRLRVQQTTSNNFVLLASRLVAGSATNIGTSTTAITGVTFNVPYVVRFQVTGGSGTATVNAHMYKQSTGDPTPTTWLISQSDTTPFITAGVNGLKFTNTTGVQNPIWKASQYAIDDKTPTLPPPDQPVVSGVASGTSTTTSASSSVTFSSVASGATYEISLNSGTSWSAQTSPYTFATGTVGATYTLWIRAVGTDSQRSTAFQASVTRISSGATTTSTYNPKGGTGTSSDIGYKIRSLVIASNGSGPGIQTASAWSAPVVAATTSLELDIGVIQ